MKFASYLPVTCLVLHPCSAQSFDNALSASHGQAVDQKVEQRDDGSMESGIKAFWSGISSMHTRSDHISAASAFSAGLSGGPYSSVTLDNNDMFPPVTETAPPPWWTEVPSAVQNQILWEQRMGLSLMHSFSRDVLAPDTTILVTGPAASVDWTTVTHGIYPTNTSPAVEEHATPATVTESVLNSGHVESGTASMSNPAERMGLTKLGFAGVVAVLFLGLVAAM